MINYRLEKEKIYEETMEDDNICTTPEPVSNATLFMSDSSLQLKSPISTTSRSPPSPTIGATPTRQVMQSKIQFFIFYIPNSVLNVSLPLKTICLFLFRLCPIGMNLWTITAAVNTTTTQ